MIILNFLWAFLVGGLICMLAQIVMDRFKLLPIHMTILFVAIGAFLEIFNIYDYIVNFAGAGALLPISSFGHSLADSALTKANEVGYFGIFQGMFTSTSAGIVFAILSAFVISLIFKPKG